MNDVLNLSINDLTGMNAFLEEFREAVNQFADANTQKCIEIVKTLLEDFAEMIRQYVNLINTVTKQTYWNSYIACFSRESFMKDCSPRSPPEETFINKIEKYYIWFYFFKLCPLVNYLLMMARDNLVWEIVKLAFKFVLGML